MSLTDDLSRYAWKKYSQSGEEGILRRIFSEIGTGKKFLVDIGACDGYRLSNTRTFLEEGWNGLQFEADTARWPCPTGDVISQAIWPDNVNKVLGEHGCPLRFDLLSLDIDSCDFWVWKAMMFRPRVVVVEFNPVFQPNISVAVPFNREYRWDNTTYYGASFTAMKHLGEAKGYKLVHQISSCNLFFVDSDFLPPDFKKDITYKSFPAHPFDMSDRIWVKIDEHGNEDGETRTRDLKQFASSFAGT